MKVAQPRVSPLWRNVVLLVGFLLLVVAGVLTVLVPELEDEPARERQTAGSEDPGEVGADQAQP